MAERNEELLANLKQESKDIEAKRESLLQQRYTLQQELKIKEKKIVDMKIEKSNINALIEKRKEQKGKPLNLDNNKAIKELKSQIDQLEIVIQKEKDNRKEKVKELKPQLTKTVDNQPKIEVNEDDDFFKHALIEIQEDIKVTEKKLENCIAQKINHLDEINQEKLLSIELDEKLKEMSSLIEIQEEKNQTCRKKLQDLQEEERRLNKEIADTKATPSDVNKRGNSMFAQVDDNCKYIEAKCKALKSKYAELLSVAGRKKVALENERKKQLHIAEQLQAENEDTKIFKQIIQSLKEQIHGLEETLREYKKRVNNEQIETVGDNLQWAHTMIGMARKEASDLREKMEKKYANDCTEGEKICKMKLETLESKKQCFKDEMVVSMLKSKLQESDATVKDLQRQIEERYKMAAQS